MAKNDPLETRIEKMAQWAAGVDKDIEALRASIVPTTEECDAISLELGELHAQYDGVRGIAQDAREQIVQINFELSGLGEPMGAIEAQASLDACDINSVTGKVFTAPQIAARAKISLNGNADYQTLANRKRELERDKASARAVAESLDGALSEYRNRNRALVAWLNNLTARLGRN